MSGGMKYQGDCERTFVAEREIRPSVLWYFTAVVLLLGGLITGGVLITQFFQGIVEISSSMRLFSGPGEVEVRFNRPGVYMIYEVGRSGGCAPGGQPAFTVIEQGTNREIPHSPAGSMGNLTINDEPYRPLRTFYLDRPVTLIVRAAPAEPVVAEGPDVPLAVGPRVGFQDIFTLIVKIFIGMGAGAVGVAGAVAIFVVTLLKRARINQNLGRRLAPKPPVDGFASPPASPPLL